MGDSSDLPRSMSGVPTKIQCLQRNQCHVWLSANFPAEHCRVHSGLALLPSIMKLTHGILYLSDRLSSPVLTAKGGLQHLQGLVCG